MAESIFALLICILSVICCANAEGNNIARRTVTATQPPRAQPTGTNQRQQFSIPSVSQNKTVDEAFELDLSYQKLDQSIALPLVPGIAFGCKDCTTIGRIEVLTGSFDLDEGKLIAPGDALTDATVTLWMPDGFKAHIELALNVTLAVEFDIPIIEVPISGFTIPRLGKAGLFFEPVVSVAFEATEPTQMGFGFELEIPKNASMTFDFSGFNVSTRLEGFADARADLLPATLNASVFGSLTTSFQPSIVFGIELDPPALKSVPQLGATISAVMVAPALQLNLSRELSFDTLKCALSKDNRMNVFSQGVSFGMGLEAEVSLPGSTTPQSGGTGRNSQDENEPNSFLGIPLPTTSIPIIDKILQATSACVGEAGGEETAAAVRVTSATPISTTTASTQAGGQKAIGAAHELSVDFSVLFISLLALPIIL